MATETTWGARTRVQWTGGTTVGEHAARWVWAVKMLLTTDGSALGGQNGDGGGMASGSQWTVARSSDGSTAANSDLWGASFNYSLIPKSTFSTSTANTAFSPGCAGPVGWIVLNAPAALGGSILLANATWSGFVGWTFAWPGNCLCTIAYSPTGFTGGTSTSLPLPIGANAPTTVNADWAYTGVQMGIWTPGPSVNLRAHCTRNSDGGFWIVFYENQGSHGASYPAQCFGVDKLVQAPGTGTHVGMLHSTSSLAYSTFPAFDNAGLSGTRGPLATAAENEEYVNGHGPKFFAADNTGHTTFATCGVEAQVLPDFSKTLATSNGGALGVTTLNSSFGAANTVPAWPVWVYSGIGGQNANTVGLENTNMDLVRRGRFRDVYYRGMSPNGSVPQDYFPATGNVEYIHVGRLIFPFSDILG